MAQADRLLGLISSAALKVPCKAHTSANITLSGEQTVNSVAVVTGDRVLVKDQTVGSENGIYVVDTGSWSRARDFDGAHDVAQGTLVPVYNGDNTFSLYAVENTSVTIGTTSIVFESVGTDATASIVGLTAETLPNTADLLAIYDASATALRKMTLADFLTGLPFRGHIAGLTLSNNSSDATNDIDIAAGEATDDGRATVMRLTSAMTKRLDAAWAVGTNQGGLDTGSVANDVYHVFLIRRSDTGVVDALFSASATAPTMPSNYDQKRRIGSIIRSGGAIVAFTQRGDEFLRTPVSDYNQTNPGTSAVLRTLSVPDGIQVDAIHSVRVADFTSTADVLCLVTSPDQADTAPTGTVFTLGIISPGTTDDVSDHVTMTCRTNTSAQIRTRLSASDADVVLSGTTHGWIDTRGRFD